MVTVLASSTKDRVLVFVTSPLCTQHEGEKAKTGWLGIRIIYRSEAA